MKKSILFTLLCLLLAPSFLWAQLSSIENVRKIKLTNADAIREGSEVKGYYFFYISDEVDKKTNEYTLQITDDNLKKLKDVKFIDDEKVRLLESSFNGTDLIFLFYNQKDKFLDYQVYGADGKKKFSYMRQLTNKEKRYLTMTYLAVNDEENNYKGLYPIDGLGFISNMPSREDRDYTFQVDFFGTDKRKQWTYTPTEGAKRFIGDYLGYNDGVVYFEVLKYTGAFDQKPESTILGLSLESGKKLFEISTDGKHRFYPATMSKLNDGKAYLYGEFFDLNDNIMKDKSKGFGFWSVSADGKLTDEKYCSWSLDLGKFLDVSSKGKIDDFGYMYLHNMVQVEDGSIYAVGEGYKKVASGLGIASKILTGGGGISAVKIRITDLLLIKFDANFKVKEAKVYEKNPNNMELSNGYEFVSGPLLAKMIKYASNGFDYLYTQVNKDQTSFSICYKDYVRGKEYKGGTFNSLTYYDGKITTDKINTKSDATRSYILPGKQGQVMVMEYYKKEKRLDMHFEKLN